MNLEISPFFEHISLFIVNIYFVFQVYIYKCRDMTKYKFLQDKDNGDDNNDAKAIAIPQLFSKNSPTKC